MTIKRITISVPEETAARIRKAAGGGSVSSWVVHVIEDHLADDDELERQWAEFVQEVAPGDEDKQRAAELFDRLTRTASDEHAA